FSGTPAELTPASDFHLLELSSVLFTDYAHKQRLVKIPEGTQMTRRSDGSIDYPNGTILTKTFFYYHDERDKSLGRRIIETRLVIKEADTWNAATYLWDEAQRNATLKLDGLDTPVDWVDANGSRLSTMYHVPTENECMTCHQSNSSMSPLGPTLRNLNRDVERDGNQVNQITHLQSLGLINSFPVGSLPTMVNYKDVSVSLSQRGRAYLAMNCAHCHSPNAWDSATEREFDFRYTTPFDETGIRYETEDIQRAVMGGEMPFIGTTLLDTEGVNLLTEYLESL
ncbi:MAG: hypothetical protein AAFO94_22185, partial [Bacteroidota bacterium]